MLGFPFRQLLSTRAKDLLKGKHAQKCSVRRGDMRPPGQKCMLLRGSPDKSLRWQRLAPSLIGTETTSQPREFLTPPVQRAASRDMLGHKLAPPARGEVLSVLGGAVLAALMASIVDGVYSYPPPCRNYHDVTRQSSHIIPHQKPAKTEPCARDSATTPEPRLRNIGHARHATAESRHHRSQVKAFRRFTLSSMPPRGEPGSR